MWNIIGKRGFSKNVPLLKARDGLCAVAEWIIRYAPDLSRANSFPIAVCPFYALFKLSSNSPPSCFRNCDRGGGRIDLSAGRRWSCCSTCSGRWDPWVNFRSLVAAAGSQVERPNLIRIFCCFIEQPRLVLPGHDHDRKISAGIFSGRKTLVWLCYFAIESSGTRPKN